MAKLTAKKVVIATAATFVVGLGAAFVLASCNPPPEKTTSEKLDARFQALLKSTQDNFDNNAFGIGKQDLTAAVRIFNDAAKRNGFDRCLQQNYKDWPIESFDPMTRQYPDAKFAQYALLDPDDVKPGQTLEDVEPLAVLTYATKCPVSVRIP